MKNIIKERGSVYGPATCWEVFENEVTALGHSKVFIVTDTITQQLCLPVFLKKIPQLEHEVLVIPEGEEHKTIATCLQLWNKLSQKGADRNSLLINLGGGVVTDLGAFVACTFNRGIEFINIPTSLLAMVDASVGGKNGVDLGKLKNQVGTIKNPLLVVIEPEFLDTLPQEQRLSGLAEMLKHGLITSEAYWNKIKDISWNDKQDVFSLIWESIEIKNKVVTEDPLEKGIRKTLNYGHTLGHAIESYHLEHPQREKLLHGEAVAVGMILATYLSSELLEFSKVTLFDVTSHINSIYKKIIFTTEDVEEIIKLLVYDKKNSHGKVCFVLLKDIGSYSIHCDVPNDLIFKAFEYYKDFENFTIK